jgi:hypothetical protein
MVLAALGDGETGGTICDTRSVTWPQIVGAFLFLCPGPD